MKPKNVIDLTTTLNDQIDGVSIWQSKTMDSDGWNASTLQLYSHCGTHMDAPYHFGVNAQTIDNLPPERFISEAWVVNLTHLKPRELITTAHLNSIAGKLQPGQSILLHTGWSKMRNTDDFRNGLPRISAELATWLGEKKVNILGVEPPSVADVNNLEEVTEIHTLLMRGDVIIVEGLSNLDALKDSMVTLIVLPLKVENGDGAPVRAVAVEI